MKVQYNLTTSAEDLDRYRSREHFLSTLRGFDGVELMICGEDRRGIVPKDRVTGVHMTFPTCWLDLWRGELAGVAREYDTLETARAVYGGLDRAALIQKVRSDYAAAVERGAEYMVFHATESAAMECLTGRYRHSDEEVVDALCELLNASLPNAPAGPLLLLENLWEPGLTFTRPEIADRLIRGVRYPSRGFMLDTGHLMHTEPALRTQKEALAYIHRRLDELGDLCRYIRGVHLNQSLTGPVMRKAHKNPPPPPETYAKRQEALFTYIFSVDLHRPFAAPGVSGLIERLSPDYLTFEFISRDLAELQRMLRRQARALGWDMEARHAEK